MFSVRDFKCDNGHITEQFVTKETASIRCGCGSLAKRIASSPSFHLDGSRGDFPTAHDKWVKEHEKAGQATSAMSHNS